MDKSQIKFLDEFVYNEIFVQNVYGLSREEMTNTAVLDIGGQYGFFALFSAENGAKQIISVEPNFQNLFHYLENTFNTNAKVICAAACNNKTITTVSNKSGESKINTGEQFVVTISFQELVQLLDPNLQWILKIDIEGAEYELLYNTAPEYIKRFKTIVMEAHNFDPYNKGDEAENLKQYITSLGFILLVGKTCWSTGNTSNIPPGYIYKFIRL